MSSKTEAPEFRLDFLKWLIVFLLVAAGVFANSYYSEVSLAIRAPSLLVGAIVALFIAAQTAKGASFWTLSKESIVEVRKVVWPSVQETHQTTLIVVAIVLITALILWGLDSLIGLITAQFLG